MNLNRQDLSDCYHSPIAPNFHSSAGRAYDDLSRGFVDVIEHCIERLAPKPGERLLDVAAATGWTARRLAERGAKVSAVERASSALATAVDLAEARNLEIDFAQGDAEDLPYDDASFDAVISALGVMFVRRPEKAAAELARVCRPGGRLAIATWTPDGNVFGMFRIMNAYRPKKVDALVPSPFEWGRPARVRELLEGDFALSFEKGRSYYREASGLAAWRTYSKGYAPLRALIAQLDEGRRERLKREFIAFHDSFGCGLGISVPRDYWVITGTRR